MPSSGNRKVLNAASIRSGLGDPQDQHRQTRKDPGKQCEQTAHLILQSYPWSLCDSGRLVVSGHHPQR
jgi:hypothetical protein